MCLPSLRRPMDAGQYYKNNKQIRITIIITVNQYQYVILHILTENHAFLFVKHIIYMIIYSSSEGIFVNRNTSTISSIQHCCLTLCYSLFGSIKHKKEQNFFKNTFYHTSGCSLSAAQ